MKDIQGSLIFAMCLLAFTAVVFFFKYGQERAQSKIFEAESALIQKQTDTIKEAQRKTEAAERASRIARQTAESNLEKARIAREMLEKAKQKSALTQKEIVDRLNAQLEREADARLAAEKASEELSKQRDILSKTVEQTRGDLQRLESMKADPDSAKKISDMRRLLKEREDEIERLKKRQAELEALNARAREIQIITEREIIKQGGLVLLPRHKRLIQTK